MAEQLPFHLIHRPAFARDDFWVSDCNKDAIAWIDQWPNWPSTALVITGAVASGKTHLARVFEQQSNAFFLTADNIHNVPQNATSVIIDNADQLMGDRDVEEALFHLYNRLKEQGASLLLTSSHAPKDWNFTLQDLKSRIVSSPVAALGTPDDQLLAVVLAKLFSDRQIFVAQEVVAFILSRIDRSFADLRNIVDDIDRKAMASKRPVTIPLVREVLQKSLL